MKIEELKNAYIDGKRDAYNDLVNELSKELDNLTFQKVSKIEIISSVIKKIRDKEKAL